MHARVATVDRVREDLLLLQQAASGRHVEAAALTAAGAAVEQLVVQLFLALPALPPPLPEREPRSWEDELKAAQASWATFQEKVWMTTMMMMMTMMMMTTMIMMTTMMMMTMTMMTMMTTMMMTTLGEGRGGEGVGTVDHVVSSWIECSG
eukprot:COSAG01_NODE_4798_length_4738_cov_3.104980_5_plen_150_part_00